MSDAFQPVVAAIDDYLAELHEEIARLEEARSALEASSLAAAAPAPASPPRRRDGASTSSRATRSVMASGTAQGDEDGDAPARRMPPSEREAQILAVIGRRPTIGTPALAREVGLSLARVAQLTRGLEAEERITRSGGGWLAAARKL